MTTQLVRVCKIRMAEEEKARIALSTSLQALQDAEATAVEAAVAGERDARTTGDAAQWALVDAAHVRAREVLVAAQRVVAERAEAANAARRVHVKALEAVRALERVIETRRVEAAAEEARKEQRSFDEIAMLLRSTQRVTRS